MYDVLEYGWYHGKKYLSKKKNIFKNYWHWFINWLYLYIHN
jgi:hypothetical protein